MCTVSDNLKMVNYDNCLAILPRKLRLIIGKNILEYIINYLSINKG